MKRDGFDYVMLGTVVLLTLAALAGAASDVSFWLELRDVKAEQEKAGVRHDAHQAVLEILAEEFHSADECAEEGGWI